MAANYERFLRFFSEVSHRRMIKCPFVKVSPSFVQDAPLIRRWNYLNGSRVSEEKEYVITPMSHSFAINHCFNCLTHAKGLRME